MQYDIALKRLLECARESFFRDLLQEDIQKMESIEELPTETVSVRRTDFPVRVIERDGQEIIHLVEFQSVWNRKKILSMIQYRARYQEKYGLPVKSTMILFKKNRKAVDFYEDDELTFRFQLIKIWELPAERFLTSGCLLPLVPLMKDGLGLVREVERKLYESEDTLKLDNLTIFGILLGLRDKDLSREYFKRRREMMIKYPMYDWILEEGFEKGLEKGVKQGLEQGAHQKSLETARAMLAEGDSIEKIVRVTGLSLETVLLQAKPEEGMKR